MPPNLTDACDETHDPRLRSWVEDANGHADFPIQNLPLGVFRPREAGPQTGIAIGDHILSIPALVSTGLLEGDALVAGRTAAQGSTLNPLLELGAPYRKALRAAVSRLLAEGSAQRPELLHPAADCEMLLPAQVGDYTDFYAGIHHALNVGRLFRPDHPLLPNYKWVPIGYHGRSSSLRPSGAPVRRPKGQRKLPDEPSPTFGPAHNLDFELELGIWIGPGNRLGEPIAIDTAERSIAGYCLLNDWSARDLQSWEYQPLGPFLAKSFHTTVSSWIITPEALAPFRQPQPPRSADDPQPLPYLLSESDQRRGALNVALEVLLRTDAMRQAGLGPQRITASHAENLYWTPAQLVAHHTSNGCNLRAGDLLGTGTISSAEPTGYGSLLEITRSGREPLTLASGEQRRFLNDGDEVTLRAHASREGFVSIGFGACRAIVTPAYREGEDACRA
jgi:fumarylacetoacetase